MYVKTFGIYPLLGSHFCGNHMQEAKSNLLIEYPHNTLQIKFNWEINTPLWP